MASRTQVNTTEIDDAVNGLIDSSDSIVNKMQMTSEAGETAASEAAMVTESLTRLTDYISGMKEITGQIAAAADKQTSVSVDVARNVLDISAMANQVSKKMQDSAQHVDNMASMYSQLSSMVGAFKI